MPHDPPRASRSLSRLRDDRLAVRASKGDRTAFAELYRRHHQRLFRYCLVILRDAEDAADALQTTMAKALSALEGGETVRGVRPWLFCIAHNTSIDTVRERRSHVDLDDVAETEPSSLTAPSAASEAEDRAEFIQAVADIQDLPERQAGALVMRELSGLSYPDIAAAFATSTGNARQLVHGARSALHATRGGRDMDCEVVRLVLSEAEGKTPRDRRVRAHLAGCADCRAFQTSISTRRSALAAVAHPLVSWAATDILIRVLAEGPSSGAGLAAGGGVAGGALGKIVGASGATKVATGAAALGTAVVVGGFVAAGTGALGGGGPGGSEAPAFLVGDAREVRRLSMPPPERAERRTRARKPAPAASAAPATAPVLDQAALVRRRPVSRVERTVSDGGTESGSAARDDARPERPIVRRFGVPALARSIETALDDLWGRLDRGGPGLFASGGSIDKADDLLGPRNRRLDRAVPGKSKPLAEVDRTVNRKAPVDRDLTVDRKPRVYTDVPANRKRAAETDVRVIDRSDIQRPERPEIRVNPRELSVNRRARAADSDGATSRRESAPERRGARRPRLDRPVKTASPRPKAVTRRLGLTRRG